MHTCQVGSVDSEVLCLYFYLVLENLVLYKLYNISPANFSMSWGYSELLEM